MMIGVVGCFLIERRQQISTRTDNLFPYTTLIRSAPHHVGTRGGVDDDATIELLVDATVGVGLLFAGRRAQGVLAGLVEGVVLGKDGPRHGRSEEHTSELQSLMRISYAVFCLKKKNFSTEVLTNTRMKSNALY